MWLILTVFFCFLPSNNDLSTWLAYYFPGTRVFEFFVGLILGLIYLETRELLSRISDFVYNVLEISSISLLIVMIILSPNFAQNLRYSLIFIPCWSLIIFIFAFQKGIISNILSNKILYISRRNKFFFLYDPQSGFILYILLVEA